MDKMITIMQRADVRVRRHETDGGTFVAYYIETYRRDSDGTAYWEPTRRIGIQDSPDPLVKCILDELWFKHVRVIGGL